MARACSAGVPFSDVASLKSLSLLRHPEKTLSHTPADFGAPRPVTCYPAENSGHRKSDSAPAAADLRPVRQQEFLNAKRDELRRLETDLEKVIMKEKRVLKQTEQDLRALDQQRHLTAKTQDKIRKLYAQLPADARIEERTTKRTPVPLSSGNTWGLSKNGRWSPGFPVISHQRSGSLTSGHGNRAGSRAGSSAKASRDRSTSDGPGRNVLPPTQIVIVPMPDYIKKSSEQGLSKSASAPVLGTVGAVPVRAMDADLGGSSGSQQLAATFRQTEACIQEEDMEGDAAAVDAFADAPAKDHAQADVLRQSRSSQPSVGNRTPSMQSRRSQSPKKASSPKDSEAGQADEDSHSGTTPASARFKHASSLTRASSLADHMVNRTGWRLPSRASMASFDEPIDVAEVQREAIRVELMIAGGGALEAFRCMDLSGSGKVSLQEFADGIHRLGLPWRELTGFKKPRELFKLFDQDRNGVVNIVDLFPDELSWKEDARMTTPEWWGHWCRKNRDVQPGEVRGAKWHFSGPEEEIQSLHESQLARESATQKRRWISSTVRRMKSQGKSDARCRECCALHLPRGTGPKDREGVNSFTEMEFKACKRAYVDEVTVPARNIQKTVYEMREQRRLLQNSRMKLFSVTGQEKVTRDRKEDDLRKFSDGLLSKLPRLSFKSMDSVPLDEEDSDDEPALHSVQE